jgi:ribose transport system substrate-binding protein
MEKANGVAAGIVAAHPNVKALLCANDNMALGAAAAVQAAGKAGQVQIIGFDNIAALKPLLADGRVLATADQHGDQLAVFGIEAALNALKDKSAPVDQQTPVHVITK